MNINNSSNDKSSVSSVSSVLSVSSVSSDELEMSELEMRRIRNEYSVVVLRVISLGIFAYIQVFLIFGNSYS